ncbi:MAG: carbohydrate-binding protein [Actinomycetes bacterium]
MNTTESSHTRKWLAVPIPLVTAAMITLGIPMAETLTLAPGTANAATTTAVRNPLVVTQAENYSSQSGIKTQTTSDAGGGLNVGFTSNGDSLVYSNVSFGTASPVKVQVRIASGAAASAAGTAEFRLDSKTGTKIGQVALTNTGGWQAWKTVEGAVTAATGTHNLYVVFKSGSSADLGNLNWFVFVAPAVAPTPTLPPTPTPTPTPTVTPTPTPTATSTMPVGDLPGWRSVFAEDFNTSAPLGSFLTTYKNFGAYPLGYTDTSRNLRSNPGSYYPEKTLSVSNSVMDAWLHYDATLGKYLVAAPKPLHQTTTYGRYSMRLRADSIPGYKIAPLLWPDSDAIKWPAGGEIDFPEGDLDGTPLAGFAHYANPNGGQDYFNTRVDPTAWHVYETAWSPGKVEFFVDGVSIGSSTTNVPTNAMHWVLQMETQISSVAPSTTAQGHVQIDWVKVYVPA